MNTYLVTFKPAEPYFFGNEKIFSFDKKNRNQSYASNYFIRGENLPSQSAILGSLRYILLPYKDFPDDPSKKAANDTAIGENSFDIDSINKQTFGKINNISPLFLVDKDGKFLVPAPLDHNLAKEPKEDEEQDKNSRKKIDYIPFSDYREINTSCATKYYANDYDSKKGLVEGFLSLEDGSILKNGEIFISSVCVGINRAEKNDGGFFKKEYKMLNPGFRFAVYADIEEELDGRTEIVCMGQGRTAFSVTFKKEENTIETQIMSTFIAKHNGNYADKLIYCFGDAVVTSNPSANALFSAFQTKDYRAFKTTGKYHYEKGGRLHRLVKAGSIFIVSDENQWTTEYKNENAGQIGFNQFITMNGGKRKVKAHLYKLECLTNLHVGSGDTNYNIIDQEVERDPITEYPVIHASGIKGALLDAAKATLSTDAKEALVDRKKYNSLSDVDKEKISSLDYIFGKGGDREQGNPGAYKFFEAKLLTRPLRVGNNSKIAYVPVTTVRAINDFIELTNAFGCGKISKKISVDFKKSNSEKTYKFLVSNADIRNIEGETDIGLLDVAVVNLLKPILGDFAIVPSFDDYSLPSVARNYLNNGVSKNLWYEEFVPHHSVLYMIILTPDETINSDFEALLSSVIQFGGNASVGNGFIRIIEL